MSATHVSLGGGLVHSRLIMSAHLQVHHTRTILGVDMLPVSGIPINEFIVARVMTPATVIGGQQYASHMHLILGIGLARPVTVHNHTHGLGVTTSANAVTCSIIPLLPSTQPLLRMLGATQHMTTVVRKNIVVLSYARQSKNAGRPSTHLTSKTLGILTDMNTIIGLVARAVVDPTVILHMYAEPASGFVPSTLSIPP